MSTYSPDLRIELITTGDQAGTWGTTTNTNLAYVIEHLEILFEAIVQSGAREDSTRIGSGGTVRRQAVDVSPLRRVNQAIYLICKGARESAFRSHKSVPECLADEIIGASKGVGQGNSYAVRKKDEIERVAKGNR